MHRLGCWGLACACLLSTAVPAQAQQAEPPAEAVELYQRGSAHYRAGRYTDAIEDLKAALALDPDSPNLVYNVARVSELLGNISEAIHYYERYIELLPRGQDAEREETRATIRRLEGARAELAAQARSEALREPMIVEVEQPPMGVADAYFWIAAGVGVIGLSAAATTGVLALSREREVRDFVLGPDGTAAARTQLSDEADTLALVSDISLGVGVLAVGGAAALFFLRDPEQAQSPGSETGPSLDIDIGLTGASVRGRF